MASNDTATPPHAAVSMEVPLKTSAPPPREHGSRARSFKKQAVVDVLLRVFLFATTVVSIIVMVTSEETTQIRVTPRLVISRTAKFSNSPAYIYFIAALSVAALHSLITGLVSILAVMKPGGNSAKLKFHFVILDSLLLGIVAAATGASGGVGYIGLKGNSHSNWNKICNRYDTYCTHIKASIFLSLIASITLLLLVWLSVYVLSKKIARR
ncbi:putative casparian strip membrane protein [Helianthus annuus]|uniref:CASP-like protein n=1 Tax=Helianthus annuus TaxID=4232 RepID=A0A251V8A7_HELAN|nr:CASP-like protein 1 [Helianthus annuus]KAF5815361.1 putative casparian strip membrane protein [Helianthus annuus]KAJ0593847.1 putative casparian strip membrane protein [Helianthus annuus]KAJ0601873.1 putative casparian strip membrane protein [Helianthus annuus]KAJ0608871.1 putative casparian strip membrane protein [Helianthus annuus]KAJ0768912.1 putative casparian strip membrane protein [Helianthus annuus]